MVKEKTGECGGWRLPLPTAVSVQLFVILSQRAACAVHFSFSGRAEFVKEFSVLIVLGLWFTG